VPLLQRCIAYAALAALGACAFTGEPLQRHLNAQPGSDERECAEFFARLDDAVSRNNVSDADAARIAGFPYLRVNRLLVSYASDSLDSGSSTPGLIRCDRSMQTEDESK
jgi:hypothetical protein